MAVSAFGMCCGYYEKVLSGNIKWGNFYKKRYAKILPFFLFLIIIDLAINFSISSLYEGFAEATLLHGFIPNPINVIGVGWFLGTVFIFYLIFPFYCTLIETKRRAWIAFLISILLNYICEKHFELNRKNFLYSLCYFLAGGLIYLYKGKLEKIKWYIFLPILIITLTAYFILGSNTLTILSTVIVLITLSISLNIKKIGAIAFISNISLEIYLSHMLIFRAVEIFSLNTKFGDGWLQYLISSVLVVIGTILFSFITQTVFNKLSSIFKNKKSLSKQ